MAGHHPVWEPLALDENGNLYLPQCTIGGHVDDEHLNPGAPPAPPIDYLRLDNLSAHDEHGTATRTTYAPLQYNAYNPTFAQYHHIARAPTTPRTTRTPPPMPPTYYQNTAYLQQTSPMNFEEHALPPTRYNPYNQYAGYVQTPSDVMGGAHVGDNTAISTHTWLQNSYTVTDFLNYGAFDPYSNGGTPVPPTPVPVAHPQPSVTPSAATTRTNGPLICYRAGCNSKRFTTRSSLRKHIINHLPDYYRDYRCSKPGCSRCFWFPKDILRHGCNMHSGVETRCPYCNASFLAEDNDEEKAEERVKIHIAARHKDSRGVDTMSVEDIFAILAHLDESVTETSSVGSPSMVMSPGMDNIPPTPFTGQNTLFAPLTPHASNPIPFRGYQAGPGYSTEDNTNMYLGQDHKHD